MLVTGLECDILYLDIGSNNGETIENFLQRTTETQLNKLILNDFKFSMSQACVVGFEPNPRWNSKLNEIRKKYTGNVSSLNIYTNTAAVASEDEFVQLSIDATKKNVGASIYTGKFYKKTRANAIRLSRYIEQYLSTIRSGSKPVILIRMDIEGYEYTLLPELLTSGVLRSHKTYFAIEWHRYLKKSSHEILDSKMQHFNRAHTCKTDCSSIYQNLEKILTYMIQVSGGTVIY